MNLCCRPRSAEGLQHEYGNRDRRPGEQRQRVQGYADTGAIDDPVVFGSHNDLRTPLPFRRAGREKVRFGRPVYLLIRRRSSKSFTNELR
jgi:hypothetical protein